MRVLRTIDITKVSSTDFVANIFKFLGKLLLESFAKIFLQELVTTGNLSPYFSLEAPLKLIQQSRASCLAKLFLIALGTLK